MAGGIPGLLRIFISKYPLIFVGFVNSFYNLREGDKYEKNSPYRFLVVGTHGGNGRFVFYRVDRIAPQTGIELFKLHPMSFSPMVLYHDVYRPALHDAQGETRIHPACGYRGSGLYCVLLGSILYSVVRHPAELAEYRIRRVPELRVRPRLGCIRARYAGICISLSRSTGRLAGIR